MLQHHDLVKKEIHKAFYKCLEFEKPCYLTIRASRGLGKTRTLVGLIAGISEEIPNHQTLIMANSIVQIRRNVMPYFQEEGIVNPAWKYESKTNVHRDTGSMIFFAGLNDKKSIQGARGLHPHLLIYDEAQNYEEPEKWWGIYAKMGNQKNCVKIFTGTGGYSERNVLSFVEDRIKSGALLGLTINITIPDLLKMDLNEETKIALRDEIEKDRAVLEIKDRGGKIIVPLEKTIGYQREILCKDLVGETETSDVFWIDFDERNISNLARLDIKKPIYVFCDYGKDGTCALFFQLSGNKILVIDELYVSGEDVKMDEFAVSLAEKMQDMGIATLEMKNPERYTKEEMKFIQTAEPSKLNAKINKGIKITMFGDQHGRGSYWNKYNSQFFNDEFGEIQDSFMGIDIVKNMVKRKQLIVSDECIRLIKDFQEALIDPKDDAKLGFSHKNSHSIVCVLYAAQELIEAGDIEMVNKAEETLKIDKPNISFYKAFERKQNHNPFY